MKKERMSGPQLNAYELGFYAGVMAKDTGMYTFSYGTQICPYPVGHDLRPYWMKGWNHAED